MEVAMSTRFGSNAALARHELRRFQWTPRSGLQVTAVQNRDQIDAGHCTEYIVSASTLIGLLRS
jgi:hypothetical protein